MELRYYESLTRVNRHMITKLWRVLDTQFPSLPDAHFHTQFKLGKHAASRNRQWSICWSQFAQPQTSWGDWIYSNWIHICRSVRNVLEEVWQIQRHQRHVPGKNKVVDGYIVCKIVIWTFQKIPHLVKPHLETFIELVRNPNFPRHKRTVSKFEACLRALSAVLVWVCIACYSPHWRRLNREIPKEITGEVPAFVNLMFDLALTKHEATRELAKVIGRKFTDAKKIIIKVPLFTEGDFMNHCCDICSCRVFRSIAKDWNMLLSPKKKKRNKLSKFISSVS